MDANNSLAIILPGVVVALAAVAVFAVDLVTSRKSVLAWVASAGLIAAAAVAVGQWLALPDPSQDGGGRDPEVGFAGMVALDKYAVFCVVLFAVIGILSIMLSDSYLARRRAARGEFYGLLLLAITGMIGMAVSTDLIAFFISFELMSLPTYVLAGYLWRQERSGEASLKYFVTGAFSSAILAFGLALVYAATGQTNYAAIAEGLGALEGLDARGLLIAALALVVTGFGFKISAVPFHAWAPDVYEGAPTPVTAFMSVGVKAAAFAGFAKLFVVALGPEWATWVDALIILAVLTMVVGNVLALPQRNLKRMLAYSSIAHAGYLTLGLVASGRAGSARLCRPVLPGGLRVHEPRRLRRAGLDTQPPFLQLHAGRNHRTGPRHAGGCARHLALHAVADGHPADDRLLGQVLPLHRGRRRRLHVAGDHRRAHERGLRLLLPARRLAHVLQRCPEGVDAGVAGGTSLSAGVEVEPQASELGVIVAVTLAAAACWSSVSPECLLSRPSVPGILGGDARRGRPRRFAPHAGGYGGGRWYTETMQILFIGDVFGQPGRDALLRWLPGFREEPDVDFVIANGENAANGAGITSKIALRILSGGADVITTGNHVYRQKEVYSFLERRRAHRAAGQLPCGFPRPWPDSSPGDRR